MDLRSLRIFLTVAETGGFSRAAVRLHTVQSNVTAHVKKLENELGVGLIDRGAASIRLTGDGQVLKGYATRILALHDEALSCLRENAIPIGPLPLGSMETTAAVRLPPLLTRYHARYADVDLSLETGATAELVGRVQRGELDGAFVSGLEERPELVYSPAFEEEMVLVTALDTDVRAIRSESANQTILVFRSGCIYRRQLELLLGESGVSLPRTLEFGTLDGILGCVAAGMGVTLLPRSVVNSHGGRFAVSTHELPPQHARAVTYFIHRRQGFQSRALRAFIDLLKETRVPGRAEEATP